MNTTVQLFQFAKWPDKGRVKTRLAATLGEDGALHAHITLTLTVLEQLRQCGYPMALAWDRDLDEPPDAGYVEKAVAALEEADVVFGPSDDGGYVLIGARRATPGMLQQVAWGSETALEDSVAAVSNAGLSVAILAPRWDVDEPEDWARFLSEFGQSPTGG